MKVKTKKYPITLSRDAQSDFSWWEIPLEDLEKELATDFKTGLSNDEVLKRQEKYGKNIFQRERKISSLELLFRQIKSPLVMALIVAGIITVLLDHFLDSVVIFSALLINIAIGFFQERRAGKAFETLAASREKMANVLRDGERFLIAAESLVPGDIVFLEQGSYVPTDARLIEHKELMVNETMLTGEWVDVEKNAEKLQKGKLFLEQPNMLWMGTLISSGHGRVVVVEIGTRTKLGMIAKSVSENFETATPFQKNIAEIIRFLTVIILIAVLFIFILGMVRGESLPDMFLVAVAIAVAVMPEGLPMAVTIILAIGMESILKKGGLVKKLSAAETLGSATIILTDKTGTLTEAKMRLEEIVVSETFALEKSRQSLALTEASHRDGQDILDMAILASNAYVEGGDKTVTEHPVRGRPVEQAVLYAGIESGVKQETLLLEFPRIDFFPFESKNRFSSSLHERKGDKKRRLIFFGSPDLLLEHARFMHRAGKSVSMREDFRKKFMTIQKMKASQGMRLIGIAYEDTNVDIIPEDMKTEPPNDLVFGGILVFYDPLRSDAAASIQKTKEAGVRVIMVTGDYAGTAERVAVGVGIARDGEEAVNGSEIETMTDKELGDILSKRSVFARILPHQKQRIARILQEQGEVVVMTGDGVNDAPALRKADIGIALGSGTEVAKEAADIILLNNDFSVIVIAIEEGRRILSNLKKIVIYLLSTSWSELFIMGTALFFGMPLPLLPTQILWANLIGEGFMNFAFAFEPPEEGSMRRNPKETSMRHIITPKVRAFLFAIGGVIGTSLAGLYAASLFTDMPIEKIRTMIFASLSFFSILFAFSLKDFHASIWKMHFFSNLYLLGAFFLSLGILCSVFFFPPFTILLSLSPLSWYETGVIIGIGFANLCAIELAKFYIFQREG